MNLHMDGMWVGVKDRSAVGAAMIENRKGYEHKRYRIDKIEKFIGPERDVATIDYDLYIALLDLYCHREPALLQHRA